MIRGIACGRRWIAGAALVIAMVGCGGAGLKEMPLTETQKAELKEKELGPELKELDRLEKQLGANHPEVIQRKVELGLIEPPAPPNP